MAEQPWDEIRTGTGTQVLFSIWDTQVGDYSAFVEATGKETTGGMWSLGEDGWKQLGATWKKPGFSQGPTYPVVGVSWNDATAFCAGCSAGASVWSAPRWCLLQAANRPGMEHSCGIGF